MKNPKTMSMPRSLKTLIALTPKSKRQGTGDLPKTEAGIDQPGTPNLMTIFKDAVVTETRAKLASRKGREDKKETKE